MKSIKFGLSTAVCCPRLPQAVHKMSPRTLDQLLVHALECEKDCHQLQCHNMKMNLEHKENCQRQRKTHGGCRNCKQMDEFLRYHVRYCKTERCSVPKCAISKMQRKKQKFIAEDDATMN